MKTPVGVANAARLTNPETTSVDDFDWGAPDEEYGLTTRWLTKSTGSSEANTTVAPHEVRWVVSGDLGAYVENYGERAFDIPSSYSNFDGWKTYLSSVDNVDTVGGQFGFGITADALERALRTLSGGGRYKASRYTVIACPTHPWILTGPEGTVLCAHAPIDNTPDGFDETVTLSIGEQSVEIMEGNDAVLEGIQRVFENAPDDLLSWDRYNSTNFRGSYHKCTVSPGGKKEQISPADQTEKTVKCESTDLVRVGRLFTSREAVVEAAEEQFGIRVQDPPRFEVGEQYECGVAVGYELQKEDFKKSLETVRGINTVFVESPMGHGLKLNQRTKRLEVAHSRTRLPPTPYVSNGG